MTENTKRPPDHNKSGKKRRRTVQNKDGSSKKNREHRTAEYTKARAQEDDRRIRAMQKEAEEKARIRKEKQQAAARRRKIQLQLRMFLLVVALIAAIFGVIKLSGYLKQKKLEPGNGAGTNILQAAENSEGLEDSEGSDAGTSGDIGNSKQLSICMLGNAIIDQRILEASSIENGYNFENLYANIRGEIKKYDIRILSHESIIGGDHLGSSGSPLYNSPFEEADAIAKAGCNVVLHASEHALDKGQAGIGNCLSYWKDTYSGIKVLGIHDPSVENEDICVVEKNGIRVAILNYTIGKNVAFEASKEAFQEENMESYWNSVNVLDQEMLKAEVDAAKEQADYVILCPHWGEETGKAAEKEQENWTAYFLQCGVDLVLGIDPHGIRPVDLYRGTDGHQMLVYHSLGNFLSNQNEKEANVAGMAQIVLEKGDNGRVELAGYGVRPLVCHEGRDGEAFTSYFLDQYSESLAEENDVRATDPEFSYSFCQEWTAQFFGAVQPLEM